MKLKTHGMNKRKWLLALCLFPLINNAIAQTDFFITKQWIELFLWGAFPLSKNALIAQIIFKDPEITLLANEQRVVLNANYVVNGLALGKKTYAGNIALNSGLQYKASDRLVRLAQPQLELFTVDSDNNASEQIAALLKKIVPALLEQQVIYRFENSSPLLGNAPKQIQIEHDGIRLQY
ncbi:hypothetical protein [Polynucleobacter sp. IMCC 29146]|uniref:hypothetical protein n=1 Tax=Polynucleobacter sp. IMCC 29146 TaxID=2780953 RepID=UPI001F44F9E5|nr:hypothetical protein [Polynucleobacter sp. IMCC 29146]MCE7528883.1 hypothetical protein [Polynucleobacter sp. IMCC 29146]